MLPLLQLDRAMVAAMMSCRSVAAHALEVCGRAASLRPVCSCEPAMTAYSKGAPPSKVIVAAAVACLAGFGG